tara:strand:+ start:27 stop:239 length:213 start_codon:yes stop_codon:yes gene_type:complete
MWIIKTEPDHNNETLYLVGFYTLGGLGVGKRVTHNTKKAKQFKTKKDAIAFLRTIYSRISWEEFQIVKVG